MNFAAYSILGVGLKRWSHLFSMFFWKKLRFSSEKPGFSDKLGLSSEKLGFSEKTGYPEKQCLTDLKNPVFLRKIGFFMIIGHLACSSDHAANGHGLEGGTPDRCESRFVVKSQISDWDFNRNFQRTESKLQCIVNLNKYSHSHQLHVLFMCCKYNR